MPVNFIDVPVTVRDKKGNLVFGLTYRQFRIYEDGQRQNIRFFSVDPLPLSVAFVIDQSLPSDVMKKVNKSLSALTGAFSPADTVAVFTYDTSSQMVTDFTASQGPRLPQALDRAKREGRDMGMPISTGPLATGPVINGQTVDPNLSPQRNSGVGFITAPKDVHPLNDAILDAAKALAKQPKGRRRILYVITDGKEAGSKASLKEVVRYLLTNKISVYGTLVGDSATLKHHQSPDWQIVVGTAFEECVEKKPDSFFVKVPALESTPIKQEVEDEIFEFLSHPVE